MLFDALDDEDEGPVVGDAIFDPEADGGRLSVRSFVRMGPVIAER